MGFGKKFDLDADLLKYVNVKTEWEKVAVNSNRVFFKKRAYRHTWVLIHVELGFRKSLAVWITVGVSPKNLDDLIDNHNYGNLLYQRLFDQYGRDGFHPEFGRIEIRNILKNWLKSDPESILKYYKGLKND